MSGGYKWTIRENIMRRCPGCGFMRPTYCYIDDDKREERVCCCTCSFIIERTSLPETSVDVVIDYRAAGRKEADDRFVNYLIDNREKYMIGRPNLYKAICTFMAEVYRVERWMKAEAQEMRLRVNSDCPYWEQYLSAERELWRLINMIGDGEVTDAER